MPLFRISHYFALKAKDNRNPIWKLGMPIRLAYLFGVVWVLGIELHDEVEVGPGLALYHGQSLVVNGSVVIGANCVLRHNTTIGWITAMDGTPGAAPRIGDHVELGANVVIIGPVVVGDYARVGAGAVVVKDVPAGAVVVGNPARVIRYVPGYEANESGRNM